MYLKRIEIFDTRAISHLVVEDLDQHGVVVISGPNETGKTTIADAVKAALTLKASSNAKEVKSLRSSNSAEHPRVVVDMRLGEYDFRLDKTFKSGKNATVIEIEKPSRRTLHDADAHQWLEDLINSEQTKDVWAIFVAEQGQAQQALSLGRFGQLTGALQEATGEAPETAGERNVMDAVLSEYKKYYTENSGAERKDLKDSREALQHCQEELHKARAVVRQFDELNREAAEKDREIEKLKADVPVAQREIAEREQAVAKLKEFKDLVAAATAAAKLADKELQNAQQAEGVRVGLIKKYQDAQQQATELVAAAETAEEKAQTEATHFNHAETQNSQAVKKVQRAQALVELLESDFAYFDTAQRIDVLEKTLAEVEELNEELSKLTNEAAAYTVTEKSVEALREAHTRFATAKAVLEAASPVVELSSAADAVVAVDDKDIQLRAGAEPETVSVTSKTQLTVGDVTIAITPGSQAGDLRGQYDSAQTELNSLLSKLGVTSLDEAVAADRARKKIEMQRENCKNSLKLKLEGADFLTLKGELNQKLTEQEHNVAQREAYAKRLHELADAEETSSSIPGQGASERVETAAEKLQDIARPANADEAKVMLGAAKRDYAEADEARMSYSAELSRLSTKPLHNAAIIAKSKVDGQQSLLDGLQQELETAREVEADAVLFSRVERRKAEAEAAKEAETKAIAQLELQDAEEVELNLSGAKSAYEMKRKRLDVARERRSVIKGELSRFESANERLVAAQENLTRAEREHASLMRRAQAAKLLFETLREARSQTREAIAEPLLAKMREYGGSIFGKGTEFEMSDDLQIISRSSDEGTIDHGNLSGGAKEQIDILLRLAAAGVMEGGAGAPVIIDDALGYSDEQRLRLMNNAIARAGEHNQVIVLTCDYERFQYVSGATYHSMNELLIS